MLPHRRDFLRTSFGAVGALGLHLAIPGNHRLFGPGPRGRDLPGPSSAPMRILILGGTGFIGPHQVEYALARGHTLTLFNRGRTNTHLFPDVERLVGDRDDDLESLKGREWDVVIDNSASIPRWVRQSAGLLEGATNRYIYVSSISAYAAFDTPGMDEDDPVGTIDDPNVEEITGATYGPLKALCEQEARDAFGVDRATIVRPGLIVGPMDPTDRFTYWPVRIDRGGEVMAPGTPDDPVQVIDARDLTGWMIRCAENAVTGTFNATGQPTPMGQMLDEIRTGLGSDAEFTWVDAEFLGAHGVLPWQHMTAWIPPSGGFEGFGRVSIQRALDAGLTFLQMTRTARDTVDWWNEQPEERRAEPRAGLPAEREAEVLAAWHAREG